MKPFTLSEEQRAGIQLTYSSSDLQIELCQVKRIKCLFITKFQFLSLDNTDDKVWAMMVD